MEYAQHTWRLPLPSNKRFSKPKLLPRATSENLIDLRSTGSSFIDPSNSFHMLDEINNMDDEGYVPDYLTQDWIEGSFQQRYELMLKRREMAGIYHTSLTPEEGFRRKPHTVSHENSNCERECSGRLAGSRTSRLPCQAQAC